MISVAHYAITLLNGQCAVGIAEEKSFYPIAPSKQYTNPLKRNLIAKQANVYTLFEYLSRKLKTIDSDD